MEARLSAIPPAHQPSQRKPKTRDSLKVAAKYALKGHLSEALHAAFFALPPRARALARKVRTSTPMELAPEKGSDNPGPKTLEPPFFALINTMGLR